MDSRTVQLPSPTRACREEKRVNFEGELTNITSSMHLLKKISQSRLTQKFQAHQKCQHLMGFKMFSRVCNFNILGYWGMQMVQWDQIILPWNLCCFQSCCVVFGGLTQRVSAGWVPREWGCLTGRAQMSQVLVLGDRFGGKEGPQGECHQDERV